MLGENERKLNSVFAILNSSEHSPSIWMLSEKFSSVKAFHCSLHCSAFKHSLHFPNVDDSSLFPFLTFLSCILPFYSSLPTVANRFLQRSCVVTFTKWCIDLCVLQINSSSCTKHTHHISCSYCDEKGKRMKRVENGEMESFMVSFSRSRVSLFRQAANKLSAHTDGSKVELNGKK